MTGINKDHQLDSQQRLAFLEKAEPVRELEADNLTRLAEHIVMTPMPAGNVLLGKAEQGWIVYLSQGVVELQRKKTMPERIEQNTPRTFYPLFTEQDYSSELKALENAVLLKVNRNMFNALL